MRSDSSALTPLKRAAKPDISSWGGKIWRARVKTCRHSVFANTHFMARWTFLLLCARLWHPSSPSTSPPFFIFSGIDLNKDTRLFIINVFLDTLYVREKWLTLMWQATEWLTEDLTSTSAGPASCSHFFGGVFCSYEKLNLNPFLWPRTAVRLVKVI